MPRIYKQILQVTSPGLFTVEVWPYLSILDSNTEPDTGVKPRAEQGSEPPFHDHLPSNIPLGQKGSPRILIFHSSDTLSSPLGSQLTG